MKWTYIVIWMLAAGTVHPQSVDHSNLHHSKAPDAPTVIVNPPPITVTPPVINVVPAPIQIQPAVVNIDKEANWYEKMTGISTVILALGTICLWLITRDLVLSAGRTSEQELRAYVLPVKTNFIAGASEVADAP